MRVFFALLLTAGVALANGARPPQPPKGKKAIPVDVSVILDKEVKGYVLFSSIVFDVERFEANTEKAVTLPPDSSAKLFRDREMTVLYAVPEDLVPKQKKLNWDKLPAEDKAKILHHVFDEFVDIADKRERIEKVFIIKSIDPKKGIVVEEVKDEKKPAEKQDKPITAEPGVWVGGLFAALSITLGGLWLVRRKR